MKVILNNIRLSLDDDINDIRSAASKKLGINPEEFRDFKITKESVDARRKPNISMVYSVLVEIKDGHRIKSDSDIRLVEESSFEKPTLGNIKLRTRPVVVGTGPAGLFAGLILAQNGFKPILIERGGCIQKRSDIVNGFWKDAVLNTESNVQFGEGGAGTFSDGKLTTRINDRRCDIVLDELYKSGAPEEITYKAKPHIGSDILKDVVVNMRKRIESYGGEVRFNSKLTSLKIKKNKIAGIEVNKNEEIDSEIVILAVGHSARDTFEMLLAQGIPFFQKPFSIGVRIEHPQELINSSQYGSAAAHKKLGAADYQLFYKTQGRTVYSFCMCPGGIVVASASEADSIVTNGMSEFARDRANANSALVVSVEPGDFGGSHPLSGVEFQRRWERLAFEIGGKDYSAPVQRLEDFINGRNSKKLGSIKPSYTGRVRASDISACLPAFVTTPMKESIGYFDKKLKGFGMNDAILTGVETRTSSPVRIPRNESFEVQGVKGLYPAGEGAGYAGGIVSAAVDGIRIAEKIVSIYSPGV